MEDKIEVGEYVRTKEGYIGILIEYIPNALNYLKIDIGREIRRDNGRSDNYIYTRYGFQLKHSKQLIDLIEVGDCIEYKELEIFTEKVGTKLRENYITDIHNNEELEDIKKEISNKKIKLLSILTKKQYMANCFKVGGKDE